MKIFKLVEINILYDNSREKDLIVSKFIKRLKK
jgi:hypothetical protein